MTSPSPQTRESLIEEHQATIILLRSWYPDDEELHETDEQEDEFLADPFDPDVNFGDSLTFELNLALGDSGLGPSDECCVTLYLTFNLEMNDKPRAAVGLGRAVVSRVDEKKMRESLRPIRPDEGVSEYIFEMLERIQVEIQRVKDTHYRLLDEERAAEDRAMAEREKVKAGRLERVWFWFPSLSSKEKRKDLVVFAQDAGLTGFVLAGKPGLLCVEGDGSEIDNYMGRIKSESWSDIPSYQKKVTERLRNPLASKSHRLLPPMIDITDQISHYGQYAHRPEMGEVKKQMEVWGVEEEWGQVVMGPGGGAA